MAKKKQLDDERVEIIAGARFRHDGKDVWPHDRLRLSRNVAEELVVLHLASYGEPAR